MICSKCGKKFNIHQNINGESRNLCNRKYCLECSPFNAHNTKKIHLPKKDMKGLCDFCNKEYVKQYINQRFCSRECMGFYLKQQKIEMFLAGKLTDKNVRKKSIREYLLKRQSDMCSICKAPPVHNNKPLVFVVDHIDGNFNNNNPDNIRAICPNCNSQTDTFAGKNVGANKERRHKIPQKRT